MRRIIIGLLLFSLVLLNGIYWFDRTFTNIETIIAEGPVPPPRTTSIGRGETVWGLVVELYPSEYNTGDIIKKIELLNPSLDLNRLQVGDWIYLPTLEEVTSE